MDPQNNLQASPGIGRPFRINSKAWLKVLGLFWLFLLAGLLGVDVLPKIAVLGPELIVRSLVLGMMMVALSCYASYFWVSKLRGSPQPLHSTHPLLRTEDQKPADWREQRLQQNLEEAQILAKSGSWEFEAKTKEFFWSKNLYRLYGRDPSVRMTGPVYWSHFTEQQKINILLKVDEALGSKGGYSIEHEVRRADGEMRIFTETARTVFDELGKPLRIFGLTQDVTESRRIEEHLRTFQEKIKKIFDNTVDILFLLEVESPNRFRFAEVNPSFLAATGLAKEQVVGKYLDEIIPDESRLMVLAQYAEVLRTLKTVTWEEVSRYPSGEKTGIVRISPILNTRGVCEFIVGNVHDISERKVAERTMNSQREKLVTAAKMSALGEMAAGIAHEINNPLAIIAGYATIIRGHLASGKIETHRLAFEIDKIESTVERIVRIIRGLRLISRNADADPSEQVSLNRVIADTLELCRERFSYHKIQLYSDLDGADEALVFGRAAQLSQVLLNLLSNAFDAVENLDQPWVRIEMMKTREHVQVWVTDCGLGISNDLVEKIALPFFTTKELGRGTGLGLSISTGIIESHGGRLFYDRDSPHTRFIVELPRHFPEVSPHSSPLFQKSAENLMGSF